MRKLIVSVMLASLFLLAMAAPAFAHNTPCGGHTGREFAIHHILEATPPHVPGTHQGYSACDPPAG